MRPLLRRATACLASLLLINLTLISTILACPLEASAAAPHATHEPSHPTHTTHTGSATSSGDHSAPAHGGQQHSRDMSHCATDCAAPGCSASHCASASFGGRDAHANLAPAVEHEAHTATADLSHSVSTAPEPPPPRA